ncbi:MAG: hypothetical protein ACK5GN_13835 [Pseudomonadota bacterium]
MDATIQRNLVGSFKDLTAPDPRPFTSASRMAYSIGVTVEVTGTATDVTFLDVELTSRTKIRGDIASAGGWDVETVLYLHVSDGAARRFAKTLELDVVDPLIFNQLKGELHDQLKTMVVRDYNGDVLDIEARRRTVDDSSVMPQQEMEISR